MSHGRHLGCGCGEEARFNLVLVAVVVAALSFAVHYYGFGYW